MILRWKVYDGWVWCDGGNMLQNKNGDSIIVDDDMMDFFKANYNNTDFNDLFYSRGYSDLTLR